MTISSFPRQMWRQHPIALAISIQERRMERVLGLGLLFCGLSAFGQTTFHGNVARTGVYESAGPVQLKGVKWTFKTGGAIVASPAVADGVVYIASMDGHLFAIDQETGKEKW